MLPSHPLVQFKRGDHICLFYRDERVLLRTLATYLAAGLKNGEKCFCAQKAHIVPQLYKALASSGVDVEKQRLRGALEIHSEDEVYLAHGRFEPQTMIGMLEKSIGNAVSDGFTGFRTAGEMSWALRGSDSKNGQADYCDQLVDYEAMVEASYPGKPAIGICQYPVNLFAEATMDKVIRCHRLALEETMISTNHSTLTIRSNDYLADIVTDRLTPGAAFHYVVQRHGSRDVVSWGVQPTIDGAMKCSESIISGLVAKSSERSRSRSV